MTPDREAEIRECLQAVSDDVDGVEAAHWISYTRDLLAELDAERDRSDPVIGSEWLRAAMSRIRACKSLPDEQKTGLCDCARWLGRQMENAKSNAELRGEMLGRGAVIGGLLRFRAGIEDDDADFMGEVIAAARSEPKVSDFAHRGRELDREPLRPSEGSRA